MSGLLRLGKSLLFNSGRVGHLNKRSFMGSEELNWDSEWGWRCEPFYPRFLVWMLLDLPIELAILIVGAIKWLKRNKLGKIE